MSIPHTSTGSCVGKNLSSTKTMIQVLGIAFSALMMAMTAASAGRPQCADIDRPGSCFFDDVGTVGAFRYGPSGDAYIALWPGSNFFQSRPDGSSFGIAASNDVSLYVCPSSAGGVACIIEFLDANPGLLSGAAPLLLPGMLSGAGAHIDNSGLFSEFGGFLCPNVLHVSGTAFDESGTMEFSIQDDFQLLTIPGQQGCRVTMNEIEIVLE